MEKLFANAPLLPIFVETIQFGFWQTASDKKHNFLHLDEEDRIQLALRPVTPEQRKQREPGYRAFVKSGKHDIIKIIFYLKHLFLFYAIRYRPPNH
jgi:hypothetical protein